MLASSISRYVYRRQIKILKIHQELVESEPKTQSFIIQYPFNRFPINVFYLVNESSEKMYKTKMKYCDKKGKHDITPLIKFRENPLGQFFCVPPQQETSRTSEKEAFKE